MKIRKHIVKPSVAKNVTYGGINGKKYIMIHETANTSKGANADAHARLQANGNSRQASWQYTVDDKEVVQSFSDDAQCWHAGNRSYNQNSIGIEICVNSDGNYKKAVENAAELTKYLMDKHNLSIGIVIQHNKASGKNCPANLRSGAKGIKWIEFLAMVNGKKVSNPSKSATNHTKPTTKKPTKSLGLVDYMKSKKMDSSYNNRKKLAAQYGIKNYKGSTAQNIKLLAEIKAGQAKGNQPAENLTVDGYMGKLTISALQRYFGTVVDGVLSKPSLVIKALQKLLGVTEDGYLGPITITAMQRRFGTVQDGVISRPSLVIKELQRRLNKGKL